MTFATQDKLMNRIKSKTTISVKQKTFSADEIWEAARIGKYPPGMTVQHLINVRKNKNLGKTGATTSRPASGYRFRAAHPLAAYLLDPQGGNWEPNALHRAALRGVYPRGTTTEDLKNPGNGSPIQSAATFGHLLQGTTVRDLKINTGHGKSPWWHALETLRMEKPTNCELEIGARNILACPPIAGKLDLDKAPHREILRRALASPKMTPEIRAKLAKYPKVFAAML